MRNIDALKKTPEFTEVYTKGKYAENDLLILRSLKVPEDTTKIGISVSKKVGNSVIRHRTIRLIRESYLKEKDRIKPGYHLVVIAKPEARGKGLADLSDALSSLLKKKNLV